MTSVRTILIVVASLLVGGCASVDPVALSPKEMEAVRHKDAQTIHKDVEPITTPLTLDEALARALKYNLDRRVRMLEEALAMGQLDVSKFDLLPKVVAQAGYSRRSDPRFAFSSKYPFETPSSTDPANSSMTAARSHGTADLGLTWSLLDVGLGYYGAKQQADRLLIASERRRKAMHLLMQDVRTAFWRAASAQMLRADVRRIIDTAEAALADSRKVANERVRNPLEAMRYQRQLLENLRLLESIDQELASAQVELASLINAPAHRPFLVSSSVVTNTTDPISRIPVELLEEVALKNNPDLREQIYNARIAREETYRTLMRMFPSLSFNYGPKYDSDRFLLSNRWNEAGVQLSFNIMNLLTAGTQMKLAEAGVTLAEQRRMAAQAAVLTQVHLARLQFINARSQFARADAIYKTDRQIAEVTRNRQRAAAQSKLDQVSTETASVLSLLRRYQALAQVQVAENRLLATLGLEPQIGSTHELSLRDLSAQLARANAPWARLAKGNPPTVPQ